METCIDIKVPFIDQIEALPPTEFPVPSAEGSTAREFPVRISMRCSSDMLGDFLVSISGAGPFFAMRGISVERMTADESTMVRIVAVCGAELFQLDTEDVSMAAGDNE